jgi:hypothetical protein
MPGCQLTRIGLPQPTYTPGTGVDFMVEVASVAPGMRAIVQKNTTRDAHRSWWSTPEHASAKQAPLVPLQTPVGYRPTDRAPVLSTDGLWVAWFEIVHESGKGVSQRVLIRSCAGGETKYVLDLGALGPGSYSLHKLDMQSGEILLWKTDRLVSIGLDGVLRKEFDRPALARPHYNTYLQMGTHWAGWDAYREDGPYVVEWSLQAGSGSHRVPLGRSIRSADVDSSGNWVAVSVGRSLNIGRAEDAVYVLRASDGQEVFRKYLPAYSNSTVAFLAGFLAYSDSAGVHLLHVPTQPPFAPNLQP